jgi:hypothetical protein
VAVELSGQEPKRDSQRPADWMWFYPAIGGLRCDGNLIRPPWVEWLKCWRALTVFGLGAATRIYVAVGSTDMRKGFEGLANALREMAPASERQDDSLSLFCYSVVSRQPMLILLVSANRGARMPSISEAWLNQ